MRLFASLLLAVPLIAPAFGLVTNKTPVPAEKRQQTLTVVITNLANAMVGLSLPDLPSRLTICLKSESRIQKLMTSGPCKPSPSPPPKRKQSRSLRPSTKRWTLLSLLSKPASILSASRSLPSISPWVGAERAGEAKRLPTLTRLHSSLRR